MINLESSHNPVIPCPGIYQKKWETRTQRDTCTPTFLAVLFTIAQRLKYSRGPRGIYKQFTLYTYNRVLLSHKKE